MNASNANLHVSSNPTDSPATASASRLLTIKEVLKLAFPKWLVKHFLEADSFAMVYGPPESAKSFLALDIAFHVAAGRDWQGHKVRKSPVVYVAAEGKKGIRQRIEAFLKSHGWEAPENFFLLLQSVQLIRSTDIQKLVADIKKLNVVPGLIVIDTLARCFSGDENSSDDMGEAIREIDKLRALFPEVTVLLVHHTNKKGEQYRGSSALHGALDSMTLVKKSGDTVTVVNDKQKDTARLRPMSLTLQQVQLVAADEDGDPITSCVLASGAARGDEWTGDLSPSQKQSLAALFKCGKGAVRNAVWLKKAQALGMTQSTFDKTKSKLVELAYIESEGDSRSRRWRLTDFGWLIGSFAVGHVGAIGDSPKKHSAAGTPCKDDVAAIAGAVPVRRTTFQQPADEVPASDSRVEEDLGSPELPDDFPTDDWCPDADSDEADVPQVALSGEEKRS